jgi:hypothetical protein
MQYSSLVELCIRFPKHLRAAMVVIVFYHIMLHRIHLAWARLELTTLVVIDTGCICSCNSNYHTITTMAALRCFGNRMHNSTSEPSRYSCNIVESGNKHHNPNPNPNPRHLWTHFRMHSYSSTLRSDHLLYHANKKKFSFTLDKTLL